MYTYDNAANREDLLDIITNITPKETQLMTGLGTSTATNILHQWLTDTLRTVGVNAFIEGADASYVAVTNPTRLTNYTQIIRHAFQISDTEREVLAAGMGDRIAYETKKELANWKKTHKCDTYADEVMLKEICFKRNEIRRVRNEGGNTNSLVKALQEIMKSSALTPAQQTASSNETSVKAFGVWLRDIETKRPAEWHDEQEKYKDLDGIDEDLEDITRSIKNFMTESRDFSSMDLESILSEDGELGDDFSLTDA
jgi:hypothetical protein